MQPIDQELSLAMKMLSELTETWAQVFLKTGQIFWLKAASFQVKRITVQHEIKEEEDEEDGDYFPEITNEEVVFFDDDDNGVYCDMFLPFANVSAIIFHSPFEAASEDFDDGDE
jgi:hypothetical protein